MSRIIRVEKVNKKFKNTKAVNNLSLDLEENKIFGLLGRNGAGKTTLLDLLTAHKLPDRGQIKIWGKENYESPAVREQICYMQEKNPFINKWTVNSLLTMGASFYPNWDQEYVAQLSEQFALKRKQQYGQLSKGEKAVVNIVIALASRCPLTIFDESYMGLDTPSRQKFYDLLLEDYRNHPRTIILSTHLIDEVSKLFDEVIIIDQGQLLLKEEADYIRNCAFQITGPKKILQTEIDFAEDDIIYRKEKQNYLTLAIYKEQPDQLLDRLKTKNSEVENLSLGRLFSYITGRKKEEISRG